MVIGLVAAVVAPLAFYPFSRTIWSAIDLILRPPDRTEPSDRHHVPPPATPRAESDIVTEQVLGGRYRIVRHVARGGMAEVYLAHDQLLDRPVAVKVLVPDLARDATFVERFRREAQAAAGLNHHNIVSVYDFGQDDGAHFIVMEYVDGPTLRDIIRGEAPLPPAKVIEIGAEIAAGLAAAHQQGIVHRDMKPANVLHRPTAREREGGRLRDRPGRPVGPGGAHHAGGGGGHRHLPVARAGPGRRPRPPLRRLLAGDGALRDAGRPAAVHRRLARRRRLQAGQRDPAAAVGLQPRRPARARRHRACGPWPRTRPTASSRPRPCGPSCWPCGSAPAVRNPRSARPGRWRERRAAAGRRRPSPRRPGATAVAAGPSTAMMAPPTGVDVGGGRSPAAGVRARGPRDPTPASTGAASWWWRHWCCWPRWS